MEAKTADYSLRQRDFLCSPACYFDGAVGRPDASRVPGVPRRGGLGGIVDVLCVGRVGDGRHCGQRGVSIEHAVAAPPRAGAARRAVMLQFSADPDDQVARS